MSRFVDAKNKFDNDLKKYLIISFQYLLDGHILVLADQDMNVHTTILMVGQYVMKIVHAQGDAFGVAVNYDAIVSLFLHYNSGDGGLPSGDLISIAEDLKDMMLSFPQDKLDKILNKQDLHDMIKHLTSQPSRAIEMQVFKFS